VHEWNAVNKIERKFVDTLVCHVTISEQSVDSVGDCILQTRETNPMRTRPLNWILVTGFLAIGLLNVVFNPFAIQATRASEDCDDEDRVCCSEGAVEPICDNGEWVCPL
jgi:hypothetical protein